MSIKKLKLKEQLARALADYDNLRKRVEEERQDFEKLASLKIVSRILPAIDMFEEVQEHLGDSGLAIALKELYEALAEEGILRIDARPGVKFDEDLHECVEVVNCPRGEKDAKNNEIVEERLSGWKFKDGLVIRAAKVVVNRKEK